MSNRSRRAKSIKNELIKKSMESFMAAVQVYNNPQIYFKSEIFITIVVISWTYLLHAYYRMNKIDYRYTITNGNRRRYQKTKHGAFKHWELEQCLNQASCPLDTETKYNLLFLIGIRHEIEHQMSTRVDDRIREKLQACCINYAHYLRSIFGEKYDVSDKLSYTLQFAPISPRQVHALLDNKEMLDNVQNFISQFEHNMTATQVTSTRYTYKVFFQPKLVNHEKQSDQIIEYVKFETPMAGDVDPTYAVIKETEKAKYLPSNIVKMMKEEGYHWFTIQKHTDFWKSRDAKNPSQHYGTIVCGKTWYWYESWLSVVREYCRSQE